MAELGITLAAHPGRTKVRLRTRMADAAVASQRLSLPGARRVSREPHRDALWLAPDQWLMLSDRTAALELISQCDRALPDCRHLALDVSAALACVAIDGRGVRELLAMGSGCDYSHAGFPAGSCVRTRLARIPAIVAARGEDGVDIYIDRSHLGYLESWLSHAMRDPLLRDL